MQRQDLVDSVNAHRREFQQHKRSAVIDLQETLHKPPRTGIGGWFNDHVEFPSGELAIVTSRGDKISIPTPLIGALLALFIWMVGGTIGFAYFMGRMSSSVETLNTNFLQYQIRADAEKKALQDKLDLQQVYLQNDRERIARLEAEKAARRGS